MTTVKTCKGFINSRPATIKDLAKAASLAVSPAAWQAAERKGSPLSAQAVHLHLTPRAKTSYLAALIFAFASEGDFSSTFC